MSEDGPVAPSATAAPALHGIPRRPAMVLIDAVVRLQPGVLGDFDSAMGDSFHDEPLLGPPSYTRPAEFRGLRVPDVLLSGDHAAVERWRRERALADTEARRPDVARRQKTLDADPGDR